MENTPRFPGFPVTAAGVALAISLAGCTGVPTPGETRARKEHAAVGRDYRPSGERPELPTLGANAPLRVYLLYAMLNDPQVEAAYFDWAMSVQRITGERSLPDPRLTFQADIADMVTSVMPGLMMDFPGPGKLKAAADAATAQSDAKYFQFESAVLQAAFALKKAYYQLHFLEARIDVNRQTLELVTEIERLARTRNEVGTASLQDVLRAQIERDRLATEVESLEDSRNPLLAQFKAALGLPADQHNPPRPARFESTPLDMASGDFLARALARNPRLRELEAEVRSADASLLLASKARVPNFNAGVEVNVKPSPVVVNPDFGVTLPIWRDKIAAEIAGAQAGKRAAEARLSAEQISLAVELAEKNFLFRESNRNLELLRDRLLPKARESVEVARSGYVSGSVDFLNLLDAQRTLLAFQLSEGEARVQRELALAELSLVILGTPPAGAPVKASPLTSRKEKKRARDGG